MIRFYFHPTPNPMKVALFLEESGLAYEIVPVDTRKGEQHAAALRAINPNGKLPAIVDMDGVGGAPVTIFDSTAILLYLGEKIGHFIGSTANRAELLSWLMFVASGVGPYSGQAVHFQHAAPDQIPYAINRYRREADRHYRVLDAHLRGRSYISGGEYSIADMSAWGWIDRMKYVLPGAVDPLTTYPNLERWFQTIDGRAAVARARAVGRNISFKQEMDEEARRALFPSNYPLVAA